MKVLIVDDEIFSIRILDALIHWDALGVKEKQQARSGSEGLQKALEFEPDIMITDIRMPDLSGLELAEKVLRAYPDTKVILMSAFADFSYIQKGMKLGCVDYILKPIDEAEFEKTLKRVIYMIEGEKEQEETNKKNASRVDDMNLYQYIRTGHGKNKVIGKDAARFSSSYVIMYIQLADMTIDDHSSADNIEIEHEGYYSSLIRNIFADRTGFLKQLSFEEGTWIILQKDEGRQQTIDTAEMICREIESRTGHKFTVCFSSPWEGLDDLHKAWKEVSRLSRYGLTLGDHDVIGPDYNCSSEDLKIVLEYREKEKKEQVQDNTQKYSETVRKALDIIDQNFAKNLSLEDICNDLSVSKNYFSYLFKRETGMNLWNYLTEIRLNKARQLLRDTELRSYEIAFEVGYDNPSYFAKLFKKHENMTPGEYRESLRQKQE